jgi:hypothetical protein
MIKQKLGRFALGLLCLGFTSVSLMAGWNLYTRLLPLHLAATLVVSLEAGRLIFLWLAMRKKTAWILYGFIVAICSLSAIFSFRIEFTTEQQNQNQQIQQNIFEIKSQFNNLTNQQIAKQQKFVEMYELKLADATGRHSRAIKSKSWFRGKIKEYQTIIKGANQKINALKRDRDKFLSQIPENPKKWIMENAPKVNLNISIPGETAIDRAANGRTELLRWILAIIIIVVVELVIVSLGRLSFVDRQESKSIEKVTEAKELPSKEMRVATVKSRQISKRKLIVLDVKSI